MQLDKAIKSRKSVRKFKSKKPDWREIIDCIDTTRFAPMAGDNFSLKFILVDDKEKIEKLADCCQQDFISQTQYVVVVCSNPKRTKNAYEERGERYVRQQAGAAIQNFLLSLEEKGLSTCWIGHFVDSMVKRELKIPKDIEVEALFPVGYASEKTKQKRKIDLETFLYFNKYKEKRMKPVKD